MYREHTRKIQIGDRVIGGGSPVLIQSMTNTRTEDVEGTVAQILRLEEAGCDIIRCTVPNQEAAEAVREIKKRIHIPLVADIHFDYKMAIAAMENGADKIRINPGNIGSRENVAAVVNVAKLSRSSSTRFSNPDMPLSSCTLVANWLTTQPLPTNALRPPRSA